MSVFGTDLVGRSLILHPADDLPGEWALAVDGEEVAEFVWSREGRCVRMETAAGVCRVGFRGIVRLRGVVVVGEDEVEQARYRGNLVWGRASVFQGRLFEFVSAMDHDVGPWRGVDDAEGRAVLRVRGRLDLGLHHFEVMVTPEERFSAFVGPLLALLGGLHVLRWVHPWRGFVSGLTSGR